LPPHVCGVVPVPLTVSSKESPMSALKERIQKSINEAMKARAAVRLQTLRTVFNAVRKKEIDERKDLTDAEIEKTLLTSIKQMQETLDQAKTAGRADMIAEAEAEIAIVKEFLPQAMSDAEVEKIVAGVLEQLKSSGTLPAGNAGMGAVMKQAMATIGSRAEGKVIQAAVKKALGS